MASTSNVINISGLKFTARARIEDELYLKLKTRSLTHFQLLERIFH